MFSRPGTRLAVLVSQRLDIAPHVGVAFLHVMSSTVGNSPAKDPRIDAYIAKSSPFAQPILRRLRELVHTGCPGAVETMKWSMPHFESNEIMCGMASTTPTRKRATKKRAEMPEDFAAALKKNAKAGATFEAFTPGKRADYIEWVTGAKREATRQERIATSIIWLAEGKPHNWRYLPKTC